MRRKWLESPRGRVMLISKRSEAVIGADEEILAGNGRFAIERRPVTDDMLRQRVPYLLRFVRDGTPGSEGATVDILRVLLSCRTGERAARFVLVVAVTAPMEESEVSHRAPAIRNQYGWRETRHSLQQVKYLHTNIRKIEQKTECDLTAGPAKRNMPPSALYAG